MQTTIKIERNNDEPDPLKPIFDPVQISQFIANEAKVDSSYFHVAVTEAGYGLKFNPLKKAKFFRK